jgi:hypothetical protein
LTFPRSRTAYRIFGVKGGLDNLSVEMRRREGGCVTAGVTVVDAVKGDGDVVGRLKNVTQVINESQYDALRRRMTH